MATFDIVHHTVMIKYKDSIARLLVQVSTKSVFQLVRVLCNSSE